MKKMIMTLAVMLLAGAAAAVDCSEWKIKAVQIDLARQKETVQFVKDYIKFAKNAGYNTLVLYLEARVKTKSFPYPSARESYTPEEMKEIVAESIKYGIDLVPVVSILGHAELFFRYPEMADMAEERNDVGRFGKNPGKRTFCFAVPRTKEFLAAYLNEMMDIFPSRNFHVGLDESFNTGFCPECSKKMKTIGLGGLYLETINWARDILAKRGRRVWMWDDFYEFFPEKLAETPRDVLMCNWQYDSRISEFLGPWGHFGERMRSDWIRRQGEMGFDTIASCGRARDNFLSFTTYAEGCPKAAGGFVTQWEMSDSFHSMPRVQVLACGKYWNGVRPYAKALDESVKELFPSLDETERMAVKSLASGFSKTGESEELSVKILRASKLAPGVGEVAADPFSEKAMLDDIVTETECRIVIRRVSNIAPTFSSLYRTPRRVDEAKAQLKTLKVQAEALAKRRLLQQSAWRGDAAPGNLDRGPKGAAERISKLLETSPVAADDDCQLEVVFSLPDYHGIPRWSISGRFGNEWRSLATGGWKPNEGAQWAYFEKAIPFKSKTLPDAIRVSYSGYGSAGLCYIAAANKKGRMIPYAVSNVSGKVHDPVRIVEDTVVPATFGDTACCAQMREPERADEVSWVEILLKDEMK